jgi:hypothetical protein
MLLITHVLRVPAAEVRIKESVRHAPQRLHRCLEAIPANVELNVTFLLLLVRVHGLDFTLQLPTPRVDLLETRRALLGNLGESLGALLLNLGDRTLEARQSRRHESRNRRIEGCPQLTLERIQQGVKHHAEKI